MEAGAMDEKQYAAFLGCAVIPPVISLIQEKLGVDGLVAVKMFYSSKVYSLLEKENLKLWHYSPLTLFLMFKHEMETDELLFPEESA
jgi:hypothetical protein